MILAIILPHANLISSLCLHLDFNQSLHRVLRSSLIRRKTDWSESKKETKLVALREKMGKNAAQAQSFLIF